MTHTPHVHSSNEIAASATTTIACTLSLLFFALAPLVGVLDVRVPGVFFVGGLVTGGFTTGGFVSGGFVTGGFVNGAFVTGYFASAARACAASAGAAFAICRLKVH
jgi:hypothetical protein